MDRNMKKILIVDDERFICNSLREVLEYEEFEVDTARSGNEGLEKVKKMPFDLIISDIKMEGMDGVEFLKSVTEKENLPIPFIMISGHGSIDLAVDCVKHGAFDFIEKPLDLSRVLSTVRNALASASKVQKAKEANAGLKRHSSQNRNKSTVIIGESEKVLRLKRLIDRVAPSEARVLITGGNGTGKELVAKQLHEKSHRADGPFVEVNCAAIPGDLIESQMFGHEKGAFTSAIKQQKGTFELADGGTLFLDEIGDMSLSAQAKVLRALQEGKITRIGGDKDIYVNVRVIAATNKNLREEIERGNFREDLYHRLCVVNLHVPALNDRRDDIPLLVGHFLEMESKKNALPPFKVEPEAMKMLQEMNWSGNIRELINVVECLSVFTASENPEAECSVITAKDVKEYIIDMKR